ncbi:MAG: thioredoxin domain-containing protein, partial [bacterium]
WLRAALDLTRKQNELFWDEEKGGYFDTSGKDSSILVRMKEQYDGAEPAGNSIAAMNLLRLSAMTDNNDWKEKALKTITACGDVLSRAPFSMPQMVSAFGLSNAKLKQIVIAGERNDEMVRRMSREVWSRYLPDKFILLADESAATREVFGAESFVQSLTRIAGKTTVYVCEDYVCQLPTTDINVFIKQLGK